MMVYVENKMKKECIVKSVCSDVNHKDKEKIIGTGKRVQRPINCKYIEN